MDDEAISRTVTAGIRHVPGVTGVYPPRPVAAAAETVVDAVVPVPLRLHDPDVLVDVDRRGGRVHVVTGISVDGGRPAADTLRAVGERVRDLLDADTTATADLISVTVRLVEDPVDAAVAPPEGGPSDATALPTSDV
ncbi:MULTISPECIES: hypothetical protein [unclassified Curtobacterium]|jgi:hypothetical protein|uniref:hypothetical protein n=1 Tax=unclassified Curtobacterium TaxID=257496 RepID=UPI00052A2372|nr:MULTISPECIES: hypothetical protein [unclassified Curtobacterium]AIV40005.1 hypothetical protein NI26_06950 [Curtobacterium sp. MR_MD2014]MCM3505094.1 hypothetical protein [Curtobacterium sp. ODYSSEY 48 V2]MCM3521281.1 hypothetical protein [Curtobacterium sp. P97]